MKKQQPNDASDAENEIEKRMIRNLKVKAGREKKVPANAHKNFAPAKTLWQPQTSKTMSALQGFLKNLQLQNEVFIVTDNAKAHRDKKEAFQGFLKNLHLQNEVLIVTDNAKAHRNEEASNPFLASRQSLSAHSRWNDSHSETAFSPKSPKRRNSLDDPQVMVQCSVTLQSFFHLSQQARYHKNVYDV
jgi:hypothetical protein